MSHRPQNLGQLIFRAYLRKTMDLTSLSCHVRVPRFFFLPFLVFPTSFLFSFSFLLFFFSFSLRFNFLRTRREDARFKRFMSMSSSDKQLDESAVKIKRDLLKLNSLFPNLKILPVTYGAENDTRVEGVKRVIFTRSLTS